MESPLFVYGKRLSKMSSKLPAISMCLGGECNIQPRLNWGSLHIALEPDQRDTNAEHAQARRLCGHAFTWQNQNIYSTASFPPRRKLVEQGKGREGKGMEGKGREGEGIVHHLRWRKERHDLLRSLLQGAQASKPSLNDLQPAVMCQNHVNSVLQSSSFPMAFVHVFFFLLRRCLHARSGCCLRGGCCAHLVERAISGAQNACQHPPKLPRTVGGRGSQVGIQVGPKPSGIPKPSSWASWRKELKEPRLDDRRFAFRSGLCLPRGRPSFAPVNPPESLRPVHLQAYGRRPTDFFQGDWSGIVFIGHMKNQNQRHPAEHHRL